MRLHTKLTYGAVYAALRDAKKAGHVAEDVQFAGFTTHSSRSRDHAFEVQLGVPKSGPYVPLPADYKNQFGKRQKTRRTSQHGENYAATWHEWGWFMSAVLNLDPEAVWGSVSYGYNGVDDFNEKTRYQFCLEDA